MRSLTPSQRGAVAEAAIAAAAIELGLTVLRPLCEGRRYDLVIDLEPHLLRVQCKLAHRVGNVLVVNTRTNRCTPRGYVSTVYTADQIDALATYTPDLRKCHLIPATALQGRTSVYLRVGATANNQSTGVNWAADYELAHVLENLRGAAPGLGDASSSPGETVNSTHLGL
ncbi:MAG TPA: group I intron-associated PD-(D/E)XK endonuclease [Solirubrobacteraceae bacterium]|jgi:hypothetical protein|nr:group I intron-associated PD-(D/E)XK endonuclease [Solirubrobacteraceae bacterium]